MLSNQKIDPTMSRQLLMKGCKNIKDRSIEKAGGLQMVRMGLLMGMEYKPLGGVHIR